MYSNPQRVAIILCVTRRTVYSWLRSGKLPGKKIGGVWRVKYEDLKG